MTKHQELENAITEALRNHDSANIKIRERKLQSQMNRYGFDLLDVFHVLKNQDFVQCRSKNLYWVTGSSLDDTELTVVVVCSDDNNLKLVNAWLEEN